MKTTPDNPLPPGAAPAAFDATLRLLANAPVPAGLNERVQAVVMQAAPRGGRRRVLIFPAGLAPSGLWAESGWARAAAAAAIVFVVAGGGWGVYQRVEHPAAKVMVMPAAQPAASGGFSSAGAMRTPQTVKGPVLKAPAVAQPAAKAGRVRARKKRSARVSGATAQPVSAPTAAVGK